MRQSRQKNLQRRVRRKARLRSMRIGPGRRASCAWTLPRTRCLSSAGTAACALVTPDPAGHALQSAPPPIIQSISVPLTEISPTCSGCFPRPLEGRHGARAESPAMRRNSAESGNHAAGGSSPPPCSTHPYPLRVPPSAFASPYPRLSSNGRVLFPPHPPASALPGIGPRHRPISARAAPGTQGWILIRGQTSAAATTRPPPHRPAPPHGDRHGRVGARQGARGGSGRRGGRGPPGRARCAGGTSSASSESSAATATWCRRPPALSGFGRWCDRWFRRGPFDLFLTTCWTTF